jgi:uncharacterized protein
MESFEMANWSDPRPQAAPFSAAAGTRTEAYDAGLRAYMLRVYNYMASGVLLSGIVALGVASSPTLLNAIFGTPLMWVAVFAPLAIVLTMSFGQGRFSAGTLQLLFWAYAALVGVSLSVLLMAYSSSSVAGAFFGAAGGFAGLSLWGYTTKRDLSAFGSFLIVGLVGLIVAMLVNLFLQSGPLAMVISVIGLGIFAGLTAYHTQRTKSLYRYVAGTANEGRVTIMAALQLYLDFINMFLFLLRLTGSSRN